MVIGEKIRKVRDLKGLSQQALAEVVEISQKQSSIADICPSGKNMYCP